MNDQYSNMDRATFAAIKDSENDFLEYKLEKMKQDKATTPRPSPSIPVKDELLDMVSPIWEVAIFEHPNGREVVIKEAILKDEITGKWQFADRIAEVSGYGDKMDEANAKAICTSVNNTYGKGFNPAAMEELYKALAKVVGYLADLNGSEWIKGQDAGSLDMKQRAKNLQSVTYRTLTNAKTIKP